MRVGGQIMRRPITNGGFWLCTLLNMMFNLEWTIPAWLLLAAHFIWDISIWWFVGALGIWAAVMMFIAGVLNWANSCRTSAPKQTNKNPYSAKSFPGLSDKEN